MGSTKGQKKRLFRRIDIDVKGMKRQLFPVGYMDGGFEAEYSGDEKKIPD